MNKVKLVLILLLTPVLVLVNGSVSYAHNSLGRLSSVGRSSSSNAVSYAYDLRGLLTNISTGSFTEELFYADGPGTGTL